MGREKCAVEGGFKGHNSGLRRWFKASTHAQITSDARPILFDPVLIFVVGTKEDMIIAKNNQKTRSRKYADWKLLKHECRQSITCDNSMNEDAFDPGEVSTDECLQDSREKHQVHKGQQI